MNKAVDQYESEIRERFTLAVERLNDIPDECNNPAYEGDYYYPDFFMKKAEEYISYSLKRTIKMGLKPLLPQD